MNHEVMGRIGKKWTVQGMGRVVGRGLGEMGSVCLCVCVGGCTC